MAWSASDNITEKTFTNTSQQFLNRCFGTHLSAFIRTGLKEQANSLKWRKNFRPTLCLPSQIKLIKKFKSVFAEGCKKQRKAINWLLTVTAAVGEQLENKPTLNPRHRNADLPSSQQWHPSERRPLLPSTALFRGIHLSSAGLKADGTREPCS